MSAVIVALFTFGSLDMLDPYGITTLLMLLQLVRKEWHALIKVVGVYITYWWTAVAIYFGAHKFLFRFFGELPRHYPIHMGVFGIIVGIISMVAAAILAVRLVRNWQSADHDLSQVIFIKSVHPVFLIFFAIFSVWSNIPVLWPLFSFIAVLMTVHPSFIAVVAIMGLFALMSVIPQIAVYVLYQRMESERFAVVMSRVKCWMCRFTLAAIPCVLVLISLWGFQTGLNHLGILHPLPR